MSNKRIRELEGLAGVELTTRLAELREQLFQHRFRNSMRTLDNPLKIRNTRRDIARLETLIRREQRAQAAAQGEKSKGGTA